MRRPISALVHLVLALLLIGCGSAAAPLTPAGPTASPSPTPVPPFDGPTIDLSAKGQQFEALELEAPAGEPFRIVFENKDTQLAHNVTISRTGREEPFLFKGEIFHGPGERHYDISALEPGDYSFFCLPFANMNGTLVVR